MSSAGAASARRSGSRGEGERVYLRSAVLGLELRSERQAAATVLVFRDPATGEEFDGALPEAERRRLAAERDKLALQQRVQRRRARKAGITAASPRRRARQAGRRAREAGRRAASECGGRESAGTGGEPPGSDGSGPLRRKVITRVDHPSAKPFFDREDEGRCLNLPRRAALTFHPEPQPTSLVIMELMIDIGFRAIHVLPCRSEACLARNRGT